MNLTPELIQKIMADSVIHWDIQLAGSAGFVLLRSPPGTILPQNMGIYPSIAAAKVAAEKMMKAETARQLEKAGMR